MFFDKFKKPKISFNKKLTAKDVVKSIKSGNYYYLKNLIPRLKAGKKRLSRIQTLCFFCLMIGVGVFLSVYLKNPFPFFFFLGISYGSEYVFNAATTSYVSVAVLDSTHIVVAYKDEGNSDNGTAIIGVISNDDEIAYGSEYIFNSAETNYISVATIDATHFVVSYQDAGNSSYGTAIIGTVALDDEISYGSEYVFKSDTTGYISVALIDSTHFVVCYVIGADTGYNIIGTIANDDEISYGSEYSFDTISARQNSVALIDSTHFVVAFADITAPSYGKAIIGTIANDDEISYGSEYVFHSGSIDVVSVIGLDSTHFVVCYYATGSVCRSVIGVISSGDQVAYGSAYTFLAASGSHISVTKIDTTNFVVCYDTGSAGIARQGLVSNGDEIYFYVTATYNASSSNYNSSGLTDATHFIIGYQDAGNSNHGTAIIGTIAEISSISPSLSQSLSPSYSQSLSPSISSSLSTSQSISPSISPSLSPSISPSPSLSQSLSPSISPSQSPSKSLSPSISPSESPSASLSPSISPSLSPSISPSVSPSQSLSPSISPSLSQSISPSYSQSLSPSISPSESPSASLSPSISPSLSPSISPSLSYSASLSPSISSSLSPSISQSLSPSISSSESPSASISPSPSPEANKIFISIGGTSVVDQIERNSFRIEDILTRQINRCTFTLKRYGDHNFEPKMGQDIVVYLNLVKIFAGIVVKIDVRCTDYKILKYQVVCNDYGRFLDRFLVNQSYTNQTIGYIINDIFVDKGLDTAGFTQNNVNGDTEIAYIAFKYESISSVLTQLADLLNYDWYVDYDKDLHFISKSDEVASFDVKDDDGSYNRGSLIIRKDNSQVKNVIIVRGGEYLGSTFTTEILGDGTKDIFELGYRYADLSVTLSAVPLSVGIDYIDPPENYDVLWNFQEKRIKFREIDTPSNGAAIRIGGRPYLPVIIKMSDRDSIDSMVSAEGGTGEYEYVIIDKSILTRDGARERGRAELQSYKDTLIEAEFKTYNTGLIAGQQIRVNSDLFGIDSSYIISKVVYSMGLEPHKFKYKVSLISTKTLGIIEYLQNQLKESKKEIVIRADEIIDQIESVDETIGISETLASSIEHNLQTEAIGLAETFTAQSLDYNVSFVLGPYAPPVGLKRLFLVEDSQGLE